jgi:acyl-CoA synthetase (NDP forming)
MLRADSVAVVGATDKPRALGNRVYANIKLDFKGTLYPVNARSAEVMGDRAYPSVRDLPQPVDLVVVLAPAQDVVGVVEDSIAAGHGGAYILSSGFGETGAEGRILQDRLTALAKTHDFPVVGPNCVGFMNLAQGIMANFSFMPDEVRPKPGGVAVISQSGGFGSFILNRAVGRGLDVGNFASTGNQCDVTVGDLLEYYVEQPEVTVISVFTESIEDPAPFLRAAKRSVELDKVIVAVSLGGSEAVARAALSHTASIVGSTEVFESVCDQYGVLRADSIDQLLDFAQILQDGRRMGGNRIGILTHSGGAGVLVASSAAESGLDVPVLPPEVRERIESVIVSFGSSVNPVDTTPMVGAPGINAFRVVLSELTAEPTIDAVVSIGWYGGDEKAGVVADAYHAQSKPVIPIIPVQPELLQQRGVPTFSDPTRAVRGLAAMAKASNRRLPEDEVVVDARRAEEVGRLLAGEAGQPFVLEHTAKHVLSLYGLRGTAEHACTSVEEAVEAFRKIGGAVVLKVLSHDLPHKSDAGGVVLDLRTEQEVRAAFETMLRDFGDKHPAVSVEAVLVQEMVSSRLELALGLQRDPTFGPMVAVGLGGVLIELLGGPQLLRAPFGRREADAAVGRIAGGRITHPTRGLSVAARAALVEAAIGLGQLSIERPDILSIDVNPLLAQPAGIKAVDALIVVGGA